MRRGALGALGRGMEGRACTPTRGQAQHARLRRVKHLLHGLALAAALAALGCDNTVPATSPALATGQVGVNALISDGDHVYWSTVDGSLHRVPVSGGAVQDLAANLGLMTSIHLALDTDSVYLSANGTIQRVAKTGGAPEMVVANQDGLGDLKVDDTHLYWLVAQAQAQGASTAEVRSALKAAGAAPATLATDGLSSNVLALAGSLYYLSPGTMGAAGVRELPVTGGTPSTDVSGDYYALASSGASLCTSGPDTAALANDPSSTAQAVTCAALDGSNSRVVASGLTTPINPTGGLALDGSTVYFATADGSFSAASLDGSVIPSPSGSITSSDATWIAPTYPPGGPVLFAAGAAGGGLITSDGTSVYWTDGAGSIYSMPGL